MGKYDRLSFSLLIDKSYLWTNNRAASRNLFFSF